MELKELEDKYKELGEEIEKLKGTPSIQVDDEDLLGSYTWLQAHKQIELLNSLNYKGFNNWRLPTKEELNDLFLRKDAISGFSSSYYWSSTEYYGGNGAWNQDFGDGYQSNFNKSGHSRVRCVREDK